MTEEIIGPEFVEGQVKQEIILACISCEAEIAVRPGTFTGEIIVCPDCGLELELRQLKDESGQGGNFTLTKAPEEGEDWGE